jgi:hypothetical protein
VGQVVALQLGKCCLGSIAQLCDTSGFQVLPLYGGLQPHQPDILQLQAELGFLEQTAALKVLHSRLIYFKEMLTLSDSFYSEYYLVNGVFS